MDNKRELNVGDNVWIVSSDGYLLSQVKIEKVKNNYAYADGMCYWRYSNDGKFRNRNNYLQFAMLPNDRVNYVNYYPKGFYEHSI